MRMFLFINMDRTFAMAVVYIMRQEVSLRSHAKSKLDEKCNCQRCMLCQARILIHTSKVPEG